MISVKRVTIVWVIIFLAGCHSESISTPPPFTYVGSCIPHTRAAEELRNRGEWDGFELQDVCVWCIPTAAVWGADNHHIWLHCTEEEDTPPYREFAVSITHFEEWGQLTYEFNPQAISDLFVGRCIEIEGTMYSRERGRSNEQPVIYVNLPTGPDSGKIRYCQ